MFIDQYGIKEVNDAIFQRLIALDRTDFLFFISSSYLRRFPKEKSFRAYFRGLDPNLIRNAGHVNAHRAVLDYYKRKIPAGNNMRLYPFSIKKEANIYGLIFGFKHPLGVEKFLNIAWDKNRLNGEANFDIDEDMEKRQGSLFLEFQRFTKLELFERELGEYIRERGELTDCGKSILVKEVNKRQALEQRLAKFSKLLADEQYVTREIYKERFDIELAVALSRDFTFPHKSDGEGPTFLRDTDVPAQGNIILIGNAGAGKSLIMRKAYCTAASDYLRDNSKSLPLWLDLNDVGSGSENTTSLMPEGNVYQFWG